MDRDVDGIECLGLEEDGEEKGRFERDFFFLGCSINEFLEFF